MKLIMVIEDEPNILENIIELLGFMNYEVISASNAIDGLQIIQQHLPDVVLADILMPRRNGYDLVQDIRKTPQIQHIPVILMSAHADDASRQKGLDAGANNYIVKPFRDEELYQAIQSVLTV